MNIQLTEAAEFRREGRHEIQGVVWRREVLLKPQGGSVFGRGARLSYGLPVPPYNFVVRHRPGDGAERSYGTRTQPSESEDAASLATEKARRCIRQAADHTHWAKDTPDVTAAREELERAVWLLKYVEGL